MPTITNPGVIESLVQAFLANGMDQGQAALSVGYSPSTVRSGNCTKLWGRCDVKAELKRQRLDLIKKTGYSKEQATQDLIDDRQLARDLNQPSAAISANSQLIRLYGMDQPDAKKDATVIIINPPVMPVKPAVVPCEVIEQE